MMEAGSTTLSKKNLLMLTLAGAATFWAATIVTSLLPIAAEYRAAFSNWKIQTVWIDSLPAGMIIGCGVSYFLLRALGKTPTKDPITEAAKLGLAALVLATVLIDIPRSLLATGPGDAPYYFVVGLMFNAARFLLLGYVIGCLCRRLCGGAPSGNRP